MLAFLFEFLELKSCTLLLEFFELNACILLLISTFAWKFPVEPKLLFEFLELKPCKLLFVIEIRIK